MSNADGDDTGNEKKARKEGRSKTRGQKPNEKKTDRCCLFACA